jgi:hypothetical protein
MHLFGELKTEIYRRTLDRFVTRYGTGPGKPEK